MSTDARSARVDVPTVIAISALAYTLANIVHEGLGHGRACVLLRGGMAIVGAVLYFIVAPRLLMPPLDSFLGTDPAGRAARARMLCLIPYLAGGVSLVVAGILNPYGLRVVLISAVAAAFGGTS